jgi:hypothetical protein
MLLKICFNFDFGFVALSMKLKIQTLKFSFWYALIASLNRIL